MKKAILWSEPTVFNQEITGLIENHYNCLPIKLSQNKEEDLLEVLKLARDSGGGVILAGGNDIATKTLGIQTERGDNLSKWDIARDQRELIAIEYCFEHDVPILAICRGFQLMLGVKYGLGIMQDISGYTIAHSPSSADVKVNEDKGEYLHYITCLPDHREEFFFREWTPSYHHQGILLNRNLYDQDAYEERGIEVIGTADLNLTKKDKLDLIELARGLDHRWIGVQGHPECHADYLRNPGSKVVVDKFAEMLGL